MALNNNNDRPNPAATHTASATRKGLHRAKAVVLLMICSFLASMVSPAQPAAADNGNEPTQTWLVAIEDDDAGWWIINGESAWLSPECRTWIEDDGGYFNTVEWEVIAATDDPAQWRSCDEVADLYFGRNSPEPEPVAPEPTSVWLVTIGDNNAAWWIIDGESAWLSPECRTSIEADGGYFETVGWDVIAATSDGGTLGCDELADLYFENNPTVPGPGPQPPAVAAPLSRGMNLAGDFEVTPRGSWGTTIEDDFFPLVANAGFDHVRVPIAWSAYTGPAPTFTIDENFFREVDRLVELANNESLGIVIDVHFFAELEADPIGERDRYLAIWDQIAKRYQDEPGSVVFELLNEPIGMFNAEPELWNQLAAEALAVVRQTNPTRTVIVGPVAYNHASRLPDLRLPTDDNVVATIHTYDPHAFTHQGAVFNDPVPPTGVTWRPNDMTIGLDFFDQSWGIDVTANSRGLQLDYQQQYGAIAVQAETVGRNYQQLVIETDRVFDGAVLCNYADTTSRTIRINFEAGRGTADVSGCGGITTIGVQLVGANPGVINLNRMALCNTGCDEIIVTQHQALDAMISTAAGWAEAQGVPLYIGEFGTLSPIGDPTDPQSRADWTRTIRTIAEENGVGWAYFELNAEFGAYDRTAGQWIPEILDALVD